MIDTRYEEYLATSDSLPFILNANLERTPFKCSNESNWHDDLEIQICTSGHGTVILDGERYEFRQNDIIAVGSNVIHHTGTDGTLCYTCLIIKDSFCSQMGINCRLLSFPPVIRSPVLSNLISELINAYSERSVLYRVAVLNDILLKILIELCKNHATLKGKPDIKGKAFENIKSAIRFIRKNYNRKITLDEIAQNLYTDKYSLCRDFKKFSGQTIMQYANNYRCQTAADYLTKGYSVAQVAGLCGFENMSFFTRCFKKYMGVLPSKYNRSIAESESDM